MRGSFGAQTTADEPQYLLSALSLAEDGDLDIADELAGERWRAWHEAALPEQTRPLPGGRRVSPHDPLLPVLLAPAVAVGGWVAAKASLALLAGALAAAMVLVAERRLAVPRPLAVGTVVLFSCSAPLAVYGTQVYPELPAALVVVLAAAALMGPLQRRGQWALGACVVALPWLATKYAPLAAALAALGLWRLWRRGERGAALGVASGLAVAGVVFLGVHQVVYSGWTPYAAGDHFVAGEFTVVGSRPNYAGRSVRLVGLLVGRRFGLAAWQPAWLLLVPALALLVTRRPQGWAVLAAPLAVGWLVATFVALTMHGYWFPGRQLVAVLPLAVLTIAWAVAQAGTAARWVLAGLGTLGVWSYGWLLAQGWARTLTWVVDFDRSADPWYRLWRLALPDYLAGGPATWALHGAWAAAALAVVASAAARARTHARTGAGAGARMRP